ncbi:MAG: hypothetical protein QOF48_1644, partial [Verrucomicrobiota bacterium]
QAEVRGSYLAGPGTTSATEPLTLVQQPQSRTIQELQSVTFSVGAQGIRPYTFQWFSNNVAIAGATGPSLTLNNVSPSANGAQFFVRVANGVPQTVDSQAAVLTVNTDTTKPTLVGAAGGTAWGTDATHFGVRFSEPVNQADAQNPANYSLPGFTILGGALQGDNVTVVLAVTPALSKVGCKTVSVSNIRDRSPSQNVILPNSSTPVIYAEGTSRHSRFNNNGAGFPNNPDVISHPPLIENPEGGGNHGDNYVGQTLALLSPPVTGNYRFYIASDDSSALFLSTDENPSHKVQIAREPNWSTFRTYNGGGGGGGGRVCPGTDCNISAPVNLVAGCRYYLEVIHNEGGGGDYFSVAWQTPAGGPVPGVPADGSLPIGALYISPFETAPVIAVTDPVDQTLGEGRRALLTVGVSGSPILTYQWFSNGVAIAGATGATYQTATLRFPANNGDHYNVVVQNSIGSATSRMNTITVFDDTTPPHLVSAEGNATFDKITVRFDEPVEPGSAVDIFNYAVDGGVTVLGATLGADGMSVILSLDPMTPMAENTIYTVTVSGVNDNADPANPIADNSTVQFRSYVLSCGFVLFQAYDTSSTPGNSVSLLTSHPNYPDHPRDVAYIRSFDSRQAYPNDSHEQYGGRISGVFLPPVSGNYIFYLKSDDASQLFLNPTGKSAGGKVLLTEETGCCGAFSGHASAPQSLTAGQAYYIEGLYKEGGGGDYIQVAAKLDTDPTAPDALSPIGSGSLGLYTAPGTATFTFTTQPVSQTKSENQTVTFTAAATASGAITQPSIQWQRSDDMGATWVNIPGANSGTYSKSFLSIANDNGDKYRALFCVPGNSGYSAVATLTVIEDHQPPTVTGCSGSGTMDMFTLVFDEPVEPGSATDTFNYQITDSSGNPLTINSLNLSADGMHLTIVTARQAENVNYTVTINNVTDIASPPNSIAADTHVNCHSFIFSCGFVLFETYDTPAAGTAVSLLTSSPNYPNNPRERFYIPTFDTRNAYPNDSHEQYGGRISGEFVPKVSGNYIFYIRSDDASELWFNPNGADAGGAIKIQEETGCCGAFAGHATAPQALTAGQKYYIMALYKEGGGGDYAQVAVKLDTDPTDPNSLAPISSGNLGLFADPQGAVINVTQLPVSQQFCQISAGPPTPAPANLASEDFNSGNGGFTVQTPIAFNGPWVYDSARGAWHAEGQDPEDSHPNTSYLTSPAYHITQAGSVQLSFKHRWAFEFDGTAWDGGQVRISVNGGPYIAIPATSFPLNGYNGTIYTGSSSELHGQPGYISQSANYNDPSPYLTTIANLGAFNSGDTISIQFMAASDTNTKGQAPGWEIDSFALAQGIADATQVTFVSSATASIQGNPNQTIFYQWQRDDGTGFRDIPGANSPTYTIVPKLSDNGACFRVTLYIPGKTTTSPPACLTVTHRNTAPSFACGSNQQADEDSGAHTVPNWATGIVPDSINGATGAFSTDFASGVPAGSAIYGNAHVDGGYLHLTDAVNSQQGSIIINDLLNGAPLGTFTMTMKVLLGQGTTPPADGLSVSIANNIPNASFGEEGEGTGLTVSFDSYDNGGAEAPAIDVKYGGTTIAHTPVPSVETGGQFVPVSIVLHADGTLDLTANGVPVYQNLATGYVPISGARFGIGGRTGGLNENNYIDDINISAQAVDDSVVEAGQAVHFNVSNNNPALFAQQPAVAPDGTLTYRSAADACGSATVTVVAMDNGGTACNGTDTSASCQFTITIRPVDDCPVAFAQTVNVNEDSSIAIVLGAFDADSAGSCGLGTLTYTIVTGPTHGTLTGTPPNLVYKPTPGYPSGCGHNNGADSFTYRVSDGECVSQPATVTIRVIEVNDCPTAVIQATPLCALPGMNGLLIVSGNNSNACIILDARNSSDIECDPLTYAWFLDGAPVPFSTAALTTNCFEVGMHHITLAARDGQCDGTAQVTIEIISGCEAIEALIDDKNTSSLTRKNKRPFLASLKAACASFERGSFGSGVNQLEAFINKVRAQVSRDNPVEAARFTAEAHAFIDAIHCSQDMEAVMHGHNH